MQPSTARRLTPAQQHLLRKQAATNDGAATAARGSAHELMLAQLYEHRLALKSIQSVERKIEAKRGFLPLYQPWIDGVLQADTGGADLVVSTVFVWSIDTGDYARALQLGDYVLRHGLKLPDHYQRDAATTLIDEMADAWLRGRMPADRAVDLLMRVDLLTQPHDVPDQARAKLHKAIGYAIAGRTNVGEPNYTELPLERARAALPQLQRALALFDGCGVKKDIERLERRLKDTAPQP